MRSLAIIAGALAVLALAVAGAAQAHRDDGDRKIVVSVEDIGFELPTPACTEGTITFSLFGRSGRQKGTGAACLNSPPECSFQAGCRATLHPVFTFTFSRGSLTAPMILDEVWTTDTFVRQRARGTITSGTGAFRAAEGSIRCSGTIDFGGAAPISDVVCTVRTSRHDDDDDD